MSQRKDDGYSGNKPRSNNDNKDMIEILFSEGWKQQSLVKVNGKHSALAKMMLALEMVASFTLVTMAMGNSEMVVPAIAASGFTVATLSNSLDRNLHGLVGFLDSTVSKFASSLSLVLLTLNSVSSRR